MPVIKRFDGLVIKMYFSQSEHDPPHIHVQYAEHSAVIDIKNGNILEGSLPKTQAKKIKEWTNNNKDELLKMWETKEIHKL